MHNNSDLHKIIFENHTLVSVNVLYFLPDYSHIVNEFLWQTLDISPKFPRVHKFLDFWKKSIDAKIKKVTIVPID